ncbi:MAG: helix-turn-helix domain-containing protein [Actinobacteria bacterium]|nr:helix-turn-helix domain-containing protein [Actinomycetota bacterium]
MAGDPLIGVGPALRKAREKRRLSLDEASRDTKLTVKHLRALEEEDFEALLGDPWVRGSLRTYARYLGLSADKVAAAYARHAEDPAPPPPPGGLGRIERAIAATRIRDNQGLLFVIAAVVIVAAGVFGIMSDRRSTPAPAALGSVSTPMPVDRKIEAALVANEDAVVTITTDMGDPATYRLSPGETRSFVATTTLVVQIESGGTVQLTVNGDDLGSPGKPGELWQRWFTSAGGSGPGTTPSPGP